MTIHALSKLLVTTMLLLMGLTSANAETLRRIGAQTIADFDLTRAHRAYENPMLQDMSEGLMTFDRSGKITPGLAESWEASEDGLNYRFLLRPDLRWSDGQPLVAEDFVRSVHTALSKQKRGETGGSVVYRNLKGVVEFLSGEANDLAAIGIKAPDERTVTIEMVRRDLFLFEKLTTTRFHPIPPNLENYDLTGATGFPPVSGAYKPTAFVVGTSLFLEKNDQYYGAANVSIPKVEYYAYEEGEYKTYQGDALYRSLLEGELHFARNPEGDIIQWFDQNHPEFVVVSDYRSLNYLDISTKHPFLKQMAVRQALMLAIDFDAIARVMDPVLARVMDRWFAPTNQPLPTSLIEPNTLTYPERVERAKEILAAYNISPANPLEVTFRTQSSIKAKGYASALSGMWRQIGINVNHVIHETPREFYLDYMVKGDFDIGLAGWAGLTNDLSYYIDFVHSDPAISGRNNFSKYKNTQIDTLLEQAQEADTIEEQVQHLLKAEKVLYESAGKIPLSQSIKSVLISPQLKEQGAGFLGIYLSRHMSFSDR